MAVFLQSKKFRSKKFVLCSFWMICLQHVINGFLLIFFHVYLKCVLVSLRESVQTVNILSFSASILRNHRCCIATLEDHCARHCGICCGCCWLWTM